MYIYQVCCCPCVLLFVNFILLFLTLTNFFFIFVRIFSTPKSVIRACVKGNKIDRAKSLIQVVKAKGLPLDSYFYTAAMEASDCSNALKLLHEMEAKNIPPTEVSYSVTIKACGKSGQWEKALELLDVMRSKQMKINIFVYNAAIGALSKAAKQRIKSSDSSAETKSLSAEVQSLLLKMRSDGIEPDGFSYSLAISCYGSEGQWEEALRTIQEMRNGGPNIQPNKVAYTAAISSCGRSGQVDLAVQLFEQMQEQGHTPDTVAYNALFLAYRVANRTGSVLDLWNEMLGKSRDTPIAKSTTPFIPSSSRIRPDIITVTEYVLTYFLLLMR
jgi:pentatricopeptide repeat domain-containing protein 1